jgi:hypothetical protein
MATTGNFIFTPRLGNASLSAANTAINGTGTITPLLAGVANGTRVLRVEVQNSATSVAALVNLFLSVDSGTTWRLYEQIQVTAQTPSTTVKAARNVLIFNDLVLPSAAVRLGVTTTIAQATEVFAFGGDF